jgi:hypothetical protein
MPPSIDIFSITISESTTTITDYLITVVAWWLGARLSLAATSQHNHAIRLWAIGFFFVGLGALLGGTSHGFVTYLGEAGLRYIWKGTVYAVGLSMLFAVAGTVEGSSFGAVVRRTLHSVNVIGFAVYATWMIDHSGFIYVIYHYVSAMIGIASMQTWAWLRHRAITAPWIIAGVLVTLLGAIIQQSGFTLHEHFNNNDLFHVVQIVGLLLLYRGVLKLEPISAGPK